MPSNVKLLLRGLLVLVAKEGQREGKIGVLRTFPPRHDLTITITRTPPIVGVPNPFILRRGQIRDSLRLEIEPASNPNITIRNNSPVTRTLPPTAANANSFCWFVDLEGPEFYDRRIGVDMTGFSSILTFNSGELHTDVPPNESILQVKKPPSSVYVPLGRVALTIGIDFNGATKAVFKNGGNEEFNSTTEQVTDYKIELTHDAPPPHSGVVEDANFYYTALGTAIPESDRILFQSVNASQVLRERLDIARQSKDKNLEKALEDAIAIVERSALDPVGPEAACFTAYLSRTDL